MNAEWTKIVEWVKGKWPQEDTYPPEGIEVLVTDGTRYDVAWYVVQENMWVKTNVAKDDLEAFKNFKPTHWAPINKLKQ